MDQAYQGKSVLITGATGFIGSILLKTVSEKLKTVDRIYCLYHSRAPSSECEHDTRIVWIKGDITQPNWGISGDWLPELQERVDIIFHLAAYTRWDTTLRDQVHANTLSALHGADLAATFHKLSLFLVTSSYWAQCNRPEFEPVQEVIYQDGKAESELLQIMDNDSEARLGEFPNAYAYSKNLMERLLHQRYPALPMMVARITSVTGAWAYPDKGYCDFSISLPAFVRAIVMGGVRYFPVSMKSAINDMIPVDLCVNLLLANAIDPSNSGVQVIHCSSATRNIPTLGEVAEMAGPVGYYCSQHQYDEAISSLTEKQARLNRIIVDTYQFGMTRSFVFDDANARRPLAWMSSEALARFPIDVDELDWRSIIHAMKNELVQLRARAESTSVA